MGVAHEAEYDVAVVGAGIVGLGMAWAAAKRGARVGLFEASAGAAGGSVRNFGMIWPIGQPAGERYQLAVRNRDLWVELAELAGIGLEWCGSLHLAHHEDELATLEEFVAEQRDPSQVVELWSASETLSRTHAANPEGLLGSLWSPDECRVDPRQAIAKIPGYLAEQLSVTPYFSTTVTEVSDGELRTSEGKTFRAREIVICSGADFERLFPETHAEAGLIRCKLQMLRTVPQVAGWRLGPHLASGLTLRHYEAFAGCPSRQRVQDRIAQTAPELDRYGIHVMLSQSLDGQVVLGDSHEYGADIEPFDKAEIEQLMLRELRQVFRLPLWDIEQRWSGVYAKLRDRPFLLEQPAGHEHVRIVNGFGGAGMSLSLAVTDQVADTMLTTTVGS